MSGERVRIVTMDIRRLVARRTDLSTFLVHLTRAGDDQAASDRLEAILAAEMIEARSMFGAAKRALEERIIELASQKCVCFTETPLEYIHLLVEPIEWRTIQFAPYGVAITKKLGRLWGVNPVWYLDITPGHDWLTRPVNDLITEALEAETFEGSPIERLAPFIEQMGTQTGNYRKEFWWEREWRFPGDFHFPSQVVALCPEAEIPRFERVVETYLRKPVFLDPSWGLEQIIGRLAGFRRDEIEVF